MLVGSDNTGVAPHDFPVDKAASQRTVFIHNKSFRPYSDVNISVSGTSCIHDNNITDVTDIMILVGIILGAPYMDPDNPDLTISESEGGDPATGL